MSHSHEELQKEIQEILTKQEGLRKQMEDLSLEVRTLQDRSVQLAAIQAVPSPVSALPEVLPVQTPPKMEDPVELVSPFLKSNSGTLPGKLPPPLPVLPVSPPAQAQPKAAGPSLASKSNPRPVALDSDTVFAAKPEVPREKSSLEFQLGTYWLVRIGIVMFLAALVFAGNYAYENIVSTLGPAPKVALLYVVGGLLTGLGVWLERKGEKLLNFSRVLFAGGLSAIYYITYAAHYVPRLQVIESPILAGALLLLWAGVMAWIADHRKSQTLAVLSVLLAYFTSSITPMAGFTLFSNLVLTAAAVFFFIRHRWAVISWVGLIGTYASFGYWRAFGLVEKDGFPAGGHEFPWFLLAVLAGYWIVFTAASFSRPGRDSDGTQKITFLTANNAAFFGYGCLLVPSPEFMEFWQWAMGLGAILIALSAVSLKLASEDRTLRNAYLSQGLLLATVGLIAYFDGQSLALVLAMESVFLLVSGTRSQSLVAKVGAYLTAFASVLVESSALLDRPHPGIYTASAVSAFLLFNAWWARTGLSEEERKTDDSRAWLFSLGSMWVAFLCTWMTVADGSRPLIFSVEAIAFGGIFYVLRLREAMLIGQAFWLPALVAWLVLGVRGHHDLPVSAHLPVLLSALILGHAWKLGPSGRSYLTAIIWQAIYAAGVIAVLGEWILPYQSDEYVVGIAALLSLVLLGYGALTRAWFLAGFGQLFLGISAMMSLSLDENKPGTWAWALLPILELILIRRGWVLVLSYLEVLTSRIADTLLWLGRCYQWAALILVWIWLARYVPDSWHIAAYLLAGFCLFLMGTIGKSCERPFEDATLLGFAALFAGIGWGWFIVDGEPQWQNLLSLLLIPTTETMARRRQSLPELVRIGLVLAGVLAVLFYVTRFTALHWSHNYWTVSWGLLAGVVFAVGFVLKHSWYRWAGLALLALSIGRVGLVDIWRFEAIYRILSLFVLSGMAIGLGFLYTKYQDKMKEWL